MKRYVFITDPAKVF